jgi:hypothetical protein
VHFWLDQNSKALAATIQALEVQKMTLATLKTMNVNLGEMAQAMQVDPAGAAAPKTKPQFAGFEVPPKPAAAPASPAAPEPSAAAAAEAPEPAAASGAPQVDPLQWWGALSEQFQTIASQALKEVVVPAMAAAVPGKTSKKAAASTSKPRASAKRATAAKKTAAKPAASTRTSSARRKP